MLYNTPRQATIVCKSEECHLWGLDRATFTHIILTAVQKKREKYEAFLERVEILKLMDKQEKIKLADAFKEEWFQPGDYIITQGQESDNSSFYMVIDGTCQATMALEPGTAPVPVKEYGPGDYFGERALLRNCPRAANIVVKTETCVVSLDRAAFKRLMGPMEEILARNEEEYKKFV